MENVGTGKSIQEQVLEPVELGSQFYGAASGFHDIVRGARALKNQYTGKKTKINYDSLDFAPLAVGAATGALGMVMRQDAGPAGAAGYGATSFVRDAYRAYKPANAPQNKGHNHKSLRAYSAP